MELLKIIDDIDLRIKGLDDYVNSKEITTLYNLQDAVKDGLSAAKYAEWFLANVPHGDFDANKRCYYNLWCESNLEDLS